MKIRSISVTELNSYINNITKSDPILQSLSVEGEISNLKYHSSGNIYFSLKDTGSKINCLVFSSNSKELVELKDGDKVICKGQLNFYEKEGSFTFIVYSMIKKGVGDLYLKFVELKKNLMEEGLFLEKYKKRLPTIPKTIGVITSPTGSVIRDIYNVIKNRYPNVEILVFPCSVQGNEAAKSIINGLDYFSENPVDLIIIARGGGSFEELFPFNDENLARAIFLAKIPIISAIGHETDYTIADFVADARASTPSMAAEIAVPSQIHLLQEVNTKIELIKNQIWKNSDLLESKLSIAKEGLSTINPNRRILDMEAQLKRIKSNLQEQIEIKVHLKDREIIMLLEILSTSNPIIPLNRGFSLLRDLDNNIINSIDQVDINQQIAIEFKERRIIAEVKEII